MSTTSEISVSFDKSLIVALGEKLYSERIDFFRELVNNAYDADANTVKIEVSDGEITIEDDGSGMDLNDLSNYFLIGSQGKKTQSVSPIFQRSRIGEFGIGKFSALAVCDSFILETQKGEFHGRIIFSKKAWEDQPDSWELVVEHLERYPFQEHFTKITLTNVTKAFPLPEVARHLRERVPIGSPNFHVFLNGKEIVPIALQGRRFPINFYLPYGHVTGEVILSKSVGAENRAGISIRVKGVTVQYEYFGFESSPIFGNGKLQGSVHAHFLPITSNRDSCIKDTQEFMLFYEYMQKFLKKIAKDITDEKLREEDTKSSKTLKDALHMVGKALKDLPDLFPETPGEIPVGKEELEDDFFGQTDEDLTEGFAVSKPKIMEDIRDEQESLLDDTFAHTAEDLQEPFSEMSENEPVPQLIMGKPPKHTNKKEEKTLLVGGNRAIVRRLKLKNTGIICRMEHLGDDQEASFMENNVIYINLDHPLYERFQKSEKELTGYLLSMLTKELSICKYPDDSRASYNIQALLLEKVG